MEQLSSIQTTSQASVPDWLNATPTAITTPLVAQAPAERTRLTKELLNATFESMFERVLGELVNGRTLKDVISTDARGIDYRAFWAWVKRDPQRMERYKEAKELRTEWWAGRIVEIAEADDSLEDVARSKLKIDTYKWLMGADNRKTYGESKQIEVNQSISIIAALEQANSRLLPMVDEVEPLQIEGD